MKRRAYISWNPAEHQNFQTQDTHKYLGLFASTTHEIVRAGELKMKIATLLGLIAQAQEGGVPTLHLPGVGVRADCFSTHPLYELQASLAVLEPWRL